MLCWGGCSRRVLWHWIWLPLGNALWHAFLLFSLSPPLKMWLVKKIGSWKALCWRQCKHFARLHSKGLKPGHIQAFQSSQPHDCCAHWWQWAATRRHAMCSMPAEVTGPRVRQDMARPPHPLHKGVRVVWAAQSRAIPPCNAVGWEACATGIRVGGGEWRMDTIKSQQLLVCCSHGAN